MTTVSSESEVLDRITGPGEVAALPADQLPVLAAQMRDLLVNAVTATGGHPGAGLGVVKLTIAVHRHRLVMCVEDGVRHGGAGTRLAQAIADAGVRTPCHPLGLPTEFITHASRTHLPTEHGLPGPGITANCQRLLRRIDSPDPTVSAP